MENQTAEDLENCLVNKAITDFAGVISDIPADIAAEMSVVGLNNEFEREKSRIAKAVSAGARKGETKVFFYTDCRLVERITKELDDAGYDFEVDPDFQGSSVGIKIDWTEATDLILGDRKK